MPAPSFIARRRRALQAAAELLADLDTDQEQPVDVFGAIEQLGLWLVFQPLRNLLGVVVPHGSGGILLTTQRQPSVQRYTAAHEIGHWLLDQDRLAFDTEDDIFSPGAAERERLAQLFASYFLMPPPLVHATVARHRVGRSDPMGAAQAYLVARDMNVSYEAATRQLANLGIVTEAQRDALLDVPPLRAKQELAHGHRPQNGYADVWPVDERSMHHRLDVLLDDEIVVTLPENRTTGHRWLDDAALAARAGRVQRPAPPRFATSRMAPPRSDERPPPPRSADVAAALDLLPRADRPAAPQADPPAASPETPLRVVGDAYEPGWADVTRRDAPPMRRRIAGDTVVPRPVTVRGSSPGTAEVTDHTVAVADPLRPGIGGTGRRWLAVRAQAEGTWRYQLRYAASHNPDATPAATFTMEVTVHASPQQQQRRSLLAVDLDANADDTPARRDRKGR